VDELLRTFSAAEELLKQKVPYLRPITSRDFIQEKDAVLFTAKGRGDNMLYEKLGYARRQPSEFTMGFTFPEEIRIPEDVAQGYLPTEWTFYFVYTTETYFQKFWNLRKYYTTCVLVFQCLK
jgi:hypothetical protein